VKKSQFSLFVLVFILLFELINLLLSPKLSAAPIQVSVFSYPGLTEGNGACADEVDNLEEIISKLGYTVDRTITTLADSGATTLQNKLNASQFFFVPDMERSFTVSNSSDFPATAVTAFQNWLTSGGVFVMTGTYGTKDIDFINKVTGWTLSSASVSNTTRIDANVAGTPFDGSSNNVTLGAPSATDGINGSSAPGSANFKALWGTTSAASVATMAYGSGTIIFLGWDFYDSGYSGVNNYNSSSCGQTSNVWATKIIPAALEYASQLSGASALSNLTTAGGDLSYTVAQNGTAYCIVIQSGNTAPSAAQVKAASNYTGATIRYSSNAVVTSNVATNFSISGLSESSDYVAYVVTEYGSPAQYSTITSTSFSTKPGVPSVSSVTSGDSQASVVITASSNETNYEYSTNGGSTWSTRSPASTTSPWTITGLSNGTTYSIQFRSVYKGQKSNSTSATSITPRAQTVTSAPVISSITSSSQSLSVIFTTPTDDGGSTITNYKYSTDGTNYIAFSPAQTSSPLTISKLSTDGTTLLTNGTSYPITIKAINTTGDSNASNSISATPAEPVSSGGGSSSPSTPSTTPTPTPTTSRSASTPQSTILSGPVKTITKPNQVPSEPVVLIGGVPTTAKTNVINQTKLNVLSGQLNLELEVKPVHGGVTKTNSGSLQVDVKKGGTANIAGTGVKPLSTVQVFLPLQGTNAKEIARIPTTSTGSFSGDALFATQIKEAPLPIGKQVLQIVSQDSSGKQAVVEMTVNIAQPVPSPELSRLNNQLPEIAPGTSVATEAGLPVPVTVVAQEQDRQATVQGDGWTMSIKIPSDNGAVNKSSSGALIKLVQNKSAFVQGTGFMPGTRADVWLFSDPTLVGTVEIDENGNFSGQVAVNGKLVPVGEHTLQIQGVGDDGYVRAANLGVLVDVDPNPSPSYTTIILAITVGLLTTAFFIIFFKRRKKEEAKHAI
jgi:hypothetical protein